MNKENVVKKVELVKEFLKAVFVVAFVFVMLFFAALFSGCSTSYKTNVKGKCTIISVDTTVVNHSGYLKFTKGK
ncbi:MAG: hypothetical protein [Bacteriophage sp.]|nr:MAG: hypothetical protein [Bacteriophage sp.]